MGDQDTPGGSPGDKGQQQGQQVDWEQRFKGLSQVLNQRDETIKAKDAEIASVKTERDSFQAKLQAAEVESQAKVSQSGETLKGLASEKAKVEEELRQKRAEVNLFRALQKHPEALPMAGLIPPLDDPAAMEAMVAQYAKQMSDALANGINKAREGLVPAAPRPVDEFAHLTQKDQWDKALREAAGTPAFAKLSQAFLNRVQSSKT